MKNNHFLQKLLILILTVLLTLPLLTVTSLAVETGVMVQDTGSPAPSQTQDGVRWQDYNGKRLGVLVGR